MSFSRALPTLAPKHPLPALLLACVVVPGAALAAEPPPAACSTEAMNVMGDPAFVNAHDPVELEHGIRQISCKVIDVADLKAGNSHLRVNRAKLFNGKVGDPAFNASLVTLERIDEAGAKTLARFVLPPDPLDREMRFDPQLKESGGALYLRLAPRHAALYRIEGDAVSAQGAFSWRGELDLDPALRTGGQALGLDLEKMEGRIALVRAATEPGQRASTYDRPKIAVASLAFKEGRLVATGYSSVERKADDYALLDEVSRNDDEARAGTKGLPAGVEACSLSAWSDDPDPKGLNVRAAPDGKAKILGIVPPPRRMPKEFEVTGEPLKSEFRVVGFTPGWFLIEKITAPGVNYDAPYPKSAPQPFKGRGWVAIAKVGAAVANGGVPMGRLYDAPHAEAGYSRVHTKEGSPFGPDVPLAKIHACTGAWALVEIAGGKRGWTRSLCSNQVTNCS